jgi:NAD(P)H-flavin reductase
MLDKNVNHIIIIGICVDDCLIIGKEESVESLINELKDHEFNLKVERNFNEYLSCCIDESKGKGKHTMIQLHLLTYLITKYGDEIKEKRTFLSPGTARFRI